MARSPYLEAKVNRWCKEKKELVIEDCDLKTFNIILDYMYGIAILDSVLINATANTDGDSSPPPAKNRKVNLKQYIQRLVKLLEMSDRLLMFDLRGEVEVLLVKTLAQTGFAGVSSKEFLSIQRLAEKLRCDKLLAACAKAFASRVRGSKTVDQNNLSRFCTKVAEGEPKFAAALLMALMA